MVIAAAWAKARVALCEAPSTLAAPAAASSKLSCLGCQRPSSRLRSLSLSGKSSRGAWGAYASGRERSAMKGPPVGWLDERVVSSVR